jgi:hypothetical protein
MSVAVSSENLVQRERDIELNKIVLSAACAGHD